MSEKTVIQVLDFSGIFARERAFFSPEFQARVRWDVRDFRSLGGTMCFCEAESAAVIRDRLSGSDPSDPSDRKGSLIHWIDTGDYHYLTYFFLERIGRPFELWLLDNHPDDQESVFGDDLLSCGGWVRTARERLPMLRRVRWNDNYGTRNKAKLPVYVSIDKDLMSREFARTDWSQGVMTLPALLDELETLRGREILGVDICGGLSEPKGAGEVDFEINARTDCILINKLLDIII